MRRASLPTVVREGAETQQKRTAIVLVSGGLDSAVALFWAIRRNDHTVALTFDYFARSAAESEAASKICHSARCTQFRIKMDFLKEIEESKDLLDNPLLRSAPGSYIPCRNIIFYGLACHLAEITDMSKVVGGHNKDDAAIFPDSSLRFFAVLNRATRLGLLSKGRTGRIVMPLAKMSKAQVIRLGRNLRVPLELTWSCQRDAKEPCGTCYSCELRRQSFKQAGIRDPLDKG